MSDAAPLDFADAVRLFFGRHPETFGRPIRLISVSQDESVLTLRFYGDLDDRREYGARFAVPAHIGDERWSEWFDVKMEPDAGVDDWVRWAIALRLVEEYDTTPEKDKLPLQDGAHWFDFRDDPATPTK